MSKCGTTSKFVRAPRWAAKLIARGFEQMDTHVRQLGLLNIVFGALSLIVTVTVLIAYGGPAELHESVGDLGFVAVGSVIFHLLIAIPCIIGGLYLRSFVQWSRDVIIVTSALNLLNPPFGSLIGGYGLWVLFTPETEPLFSAPPPDRQPKKASTPEPPGSPETKPTSTRVVPSRRGAKPV
jgi:hypothetical protein